MHRVPHQLWLLAIGGLWSCSSTDEVGVDPGGADLEGGATMMTPLPSTPADPVIVPTPVVSTAPATMVGDMTSAGGSGAIATPTVDAPDGSAGSGTSMPEPGSVGGSDMGMGAAGGPGTSLPDPGTEGDGDLNVGPNYQQSPDLGSNGAPGGRTFTFTMRSQDSNIFTGLDASLNNPTSFTRRIDVYVPARYQDGTAAPFMVVQDGAGDQFNRVKAAVDNLSQETDPARRLPAFIVIAVANGGGDGTGSQRGLEYDHLSDRYGRLIDAEVLPAVLANAELTAAFPNFAFTEDPEGRGTIGCSSGGAAALTMGWFQPDRFRRIVAYSATLVALQDSDTPESQLFPSGAWDYHSDLELIANAPPKPLRIFINANDSDNGAGTGAAGRRDWLLGNQRTAAALQAQNYHYQFLFGQGAGHCDGNVQDATLADTLLWVWRGYPLD